MYSIVEIGGHQYRLNAGSKVDVEKLEGEVGSTVEFERIFLVGSGASVRIGNPVVEGAKVRGKIIFQGKGKKILGAKGSPGLYFKRKNYRHPYTALLITEITDGQGQIDTWKGKGKEEQTKKEEKVENGT